MSGGTTATATTATVASSAAASSAAAASAAAVAAGAAATTAGTVGGVVGTAAAAGDIAATGAVGTTLFTTQNILMAIGTALSGVSSLAAGSQANKAGAYNQAITLQAANNAAGAGENAAVQDDRKTALLLSRNRAAAAAGGGSASDPSVVNNAEQIAGQGEYNSLMDLYNGESKSQSLTEQAQLQGYEGSSAQMVDDLKAGSTVLTGASSLYNKYGAGTNYQNTLQ